MSKFLNFLGRFFDDQKPGAPTVPFLHEKIDLKTFNTEEVRKWEEEGGYEGFSKLIMQEYRQSLIIGESHSLSKSVSILDKQHSYGWFIDSRTLRFSDRDYRLFAYLLSKRLKEIGYVINIAERKSTSVVKGVEMITHYYLKPSLRLRIGCEGEKVNQLHGNISILYKAINGEPLSLKFHVKSYSDSNYLPPLGFNELIFFLFET